MKNLIINIDEVLWMSIYLLHGALLMSLAFSGKFHKMPLFTFLILQDILQTPILLFIYRDAPSHYLTAYVVGKSLDIVATFLAIGELLWKEYSLIGLTLEYYMMAEATIHYVLSKGYSSYWHDVEFWVKPLYIVFELIWLIALQRGEKYVRSSR